MKIFTKYEIVTDVKRFGEHITEIGIEIIANCGDASIKNMY